MRKTHSISKISAISLLVVLLVAGGAWAYKHHQDQTAKTSSQNQPSMGNSPATQADQAGNEAKKSSPVPPAENSGSESTNTASSSKKTVEVDITTWNSKINNFTLNGFVQGVIERGGTCTLTMKSGASTVTESRSATANATNTTCGEISVPASKLHVGSWTAVLSYSSPTSKGASSSQAIEVEN
jgi:hypothetical protein